MLTNLILALGAYYFLTKKPKREYRGRNNININMFMRNLQYKIRRF